MSEVTLIGGWAAGMKKPKGRKSVLSGEYPWCDHAKTYVYSAPEMPGHMRGTFADWPDRSPGPAPRTVNRSPEWEVKVREAVHYVCRIPQDDYREVTECVQAASEADAIRRAMGLAHGARRLISCRKINGS